MMFGIDRVGRVGACFIGATVRQNEFSSHQSKFEYLLGTY